MTSEDRYLAKGAIVGMAASGMISLMQFIPQPNAFSNIHATATIWILAVFLMFMYTMVVE